MNVRGASVIAGAVMFVGALTAFSTFKAVRAERLAPPAPPNVQVATIPIMSRQHVKVGESHQAYTSNPPTSGPHYDPATMATISKERPVDEALVALLERGYVWISYNPNTADQETVAALSNIPAEDPTLNVVVTARPEDDSPVAVAGWGKAMKLQRFWGTPEPADRALHAFVRSLPPNAPEYQLTPPAS